MRKQPQRLDDFVLWKLQTAGDTTRRGDVVIDRGHIDPVKNGASDASGKAGSKEGWSVLGPPWEKCKRNPQPNDVINLEGLNAFLGSLVVGHLG